MERISVRISSELFQKLNLKSQETGVNVSEIYRDCLRLGLELLNQKKDMKLLNMLSNAEVNSQLLLLAIKGHFLLEQFFLSSVEDGPELCDMAQEKALKTIGNHLAK